MLSHIRNIGLECFEPRGAFYAFPSIVGTGISSEEFCKKLIKSEKVAVIPGNAFVKAGEGFIRISYSYSLKHIEEAIKRFVEGL